MHRLATASLIVALAACGSKSSSDRQCGPVVTAMTERVKQSALKMLGDKMTDADKERAEQMVQTMTKTLVDACSADKWSDEVLRCMEGASSMAEVPKCKELLTPEQKAHAETLRGRSKNPAGTEKVAEMIKKLEGGRDAMCACKDKDCADKVSAQMGESMKEMGKDHSVKPSVEEMKKVQTLLQDVQKCQAAAMNAGSGSGTGSGSGSGSGSAN